MVQRQLLGWLNPNVIELDRYKGRQTGAKLILTMYNKKGEEVAKNIELVAVYY